MVHKTKSTTTFDTSYTLLNVAQKKAVDTIEGPVMVIAGPGTGKTTILTLHIANILRKTDTSPSSILALTFTESGAHAMRRKLLDIIGPSAYKVHIHTFHGFAEKLIQEYPDYFPRIIGSKIITDAEQIRLIEDIIKSSRSIKLLRPYGDPAYYVKPVLHEIHILKRENISPDYLLKSVGKDSDFVIGESGRRAPLSKAEKEKKEKRDEKNTELAYVYKKYEEALSKNKYYDFDDMLLEIIRAMESNPEFKLILQETYQYILADEHQDANAAQNKILELLVDFHNSPNLFIVGDDKQAIYRFQGASLENFLYFTKKYPKAVVIDLEHNYRSHQVILDGSHSVILNNPGIPGRARKSLKSLQVGGRPIRLIDLPTREDELDYVARLVKELINEKREKPEEIAILYRENNHAHDLSQTLKAHGVAHRVESDRDILQDIDAAKIITLCRAVNDPSDSENLAAALFLSELGADPADVAELCALSSRRKKPLHATIKDETLEFRAVYVAYQKIVQWSAEARTLPFHDFLQKLIQETDLIASIIKAPNSLERMASLETFHNRIMNAAKSRKNFYLRNFIDYIDVVSDHGILAKRTHVDHVSGVRLMTAHRAKGLEFNYVFIIHAVDGVWGNRSRRNHFTVPIIEHARDTGRIEDERRLFYVAMTRAREGVIVSSARSDGDKETVRSQFLSEIDPLTISDEKPEVSDYQEYISRRFKKVAVETSVSILDKGFIKSKFLNQPLSVTHLNNYLECPWRYFFVNLIRIPQPQSKHQMYGTAIHAALRVFFESYKVERDLSKKQLLDLFKHHLEDQPLSVDDRADSIVKGKKALEGYYEQYTGTWIRTLLTEYAVRGIEFTAEISKTEKVRLELTGKLDKVELLDEKNVIVVDFKTSKPKSRNDIEGKTRSANGNYKRQLIFYKILLNGSDKFNMKYGEIDFIEPNERGKYKKERFEVSKDEVLGLESEISSMIKDILEVTFLDKKCPDKNCSYCRLGNILKGV